MSDQAADVAIKCNYYLRIVTIFQVCVKQALLNVLHDLNYNGLPVNNAQDAYKELLKFKIGPIGQKLKKIVKEFQWQIICHVCTNTCAANCQCAGKTDTQDFDITIICVLIKNYLKGLPQQIATSANSARELRNKTMGHGSFHHIATQQEFDDCCKEIDNILLGLGYNKMKLFVDLQTSSLEPYLHDQLKFLMYEQKSMKAIQADHVTKDDLQAVINKQDEMDVKVEVSSQFSQMLLSMIEGLQSKLNDLACDRSTIETEIDGSESDLVNLSQELKKNHLAKYGKVRLQLEPRRTQDESVPAIDREKIVVELSVIPNSDAYALNADNEGIEPSSTEKKFVLSSSIDYKDIFESNNDYVLIFGDPGYGKTTLMETILHQWSVNELWKEKFDFVFLVYFRQLVKFKNDKNVSPEKLLSYFYPGYDFSKISNTKTLLILDGFDEFACKEDFTKGFKDFSPFVQAVYDLVDPNNPSIQFARMLTSRSGSFQILFDTVFNQSFQQNLRKFKITGFDEKHIQHYVRNHLQNLIVAGKFLLRLEESPILQKFMAVPFYCWGICYLLNKEELTLETIPMTATAIHANLLTLFIRNHGLKKPAVKLSALFEMPEFKEMIMMLSNMAGMLQEQRKLLFSSKDFKESSNLNLLVQSGLVMKVSLDFEEFDHFQFLHYSFQEFLSALHIFYGGLHGYRSVSKSIARMVFGLYGGKVPDSSSDVILKLYAGMIANDIPGLILNDPSGVSKVLTKFKTKNSPDLESNHFKNFGLEGLIKYFYEFQNPLSVDYVIVHAIDFFQYRNLNLNITELDFFEERCKLGNLAINRIILRGFSPSSLMREIQKTIIQNALICCNGVVCDMAALIALKTNIDFSNVRSLGRFKCIYLNLRGALQPELFEIVDVLRCLDCVEMTHNYPQTTLLGILEVINSMKQSERPGSLIFRLFGYLEMVDLINLIGKRLIKAFDVCSEVGIVLRFRKLPAKEIIDIFEKNVQNAHFEYLKIFKIGYCNRDELPDEEDWEYHWVKIFHF